MSSLRELYQEVILDHNKHPRNFRVMESPTRSVEGYNPLCGDHYTIYLKLDDGRIRDVTFQGAGCAISKASASVMSQVVKGKTLEEAGELFAETYSSEWSPSAGTVTVTAFEPKAFTQPPPSRLYARFWIPEYASSADRWITALPV